jgi:hypothetical protein
MLTKFKNIDKILSATKATQGQHFLDKEIGLFTSAAKKFAWKNNFFNLGKTTSTVELHVYSGDTWLTGNHRTNFKTKNQVTFTDPADGTLYRLPAKPWELNLFEEFNELGIQKGEYRIALNFYTNLIGSYESQKLKIDEISPDRTELRLRSIDPDDSEFLEQITDYIQEVGNSVDRLTSTASYRTLLVNFSRNQTALFSNSVVIGEYVYVKLHEPLADDIEKDFKCWIVEEQRPTYIDRVTLETFGLGLAGTTRKLSGPNWDASDRASTSTDTGLKNWNDILGSSVSTSQQLVDSVFSGSLAGIDLNIDYSDFNNFVFYSSATERVKNFHYKIELIEYYNSKLSTLGSISGSTAVTNIEEFTNLKNALIGGFDEFEKYLYFESSSTPFTYDLPLADPNVSYITGSYIDPWPKTTTSRPHTLYSSTASIAQEWYSTLLNNTDLYDRANYNSLINGVPLYLRTNPDNEGLETFIHMLGQHYDIIYTYIRNVSKIYSRDEHPKYGVPNELLYSVAKQFGWSLTDGNQYKDLWEYVLGTNEAGIPITGSNTVGDASLPGKDMTYHVWRRIVNNLPGLLKSKGTKRSVKALLSCYGIPQSMISINEYGGPRIERPPVYEKLNFDYALDLIQNAAGTVTVDYDQPINSVELRFRTDNVLTNPALPSTMNLFSVDSNDVTLDFTRGTLGTIQINGTSSADIEMFDGGWLNVLLRSGSNASLEVVAKKSKYGKIVAAVSASATASFASTGTVTLGGTGNGARLKGQLQELRLWSSSLQDSPFNNHTKAPAAYDGNVDAYDELVFRLPLTEKTNHTTAVTMSGVEPNLSGISASFASWTNAEPYDSIEETYYYDGISLAAGTFDDNKIRLEDNELVGTLDVKSRAERSQFDKAPLDSNRLGVYFSPQTMIDEDIIAQLGFTELDSYIGDPGQQYERSYPDLIKAAQKYWKKYETKNDLNAYIKIFTLFDLSFFKQLDQLLPARADKITGLLVQPNILERNKDSFAPRVRRKDVAYNSELDINETTVLSASRPQYEIPFPIPIVPSGLYDDYFSVADVNFLNLSSQNDSQYVAFLTRSAAEKYNGYAGTFFHPITSSVTSTTRESLSYVEYRKSTYGITYPIEIGSGSAETGSDEIVFESAETVGTEAESRYITSSIFYAFGSSSYSTNPKSAENPWEFGSGDVIFVQIVSSSNDVTIDTGEERTYLRDITLPLPAMGPSAEETSTFYEVINNNASRPKNGGGNLFWDLLYEYLDTYRTTNSEYPDNSTFFSLPIAVDIEKYGALSSIQIELQIGSGSTSTPDSDFVAAISSNPVELTPAGGASTETGTFTFNTTMDDLYAALTRTDSWAAPGSTVFAKMTMTFTPSSGDFNNDIIGIQTLQHLGTSLPLSYILANISSSRIDNSNIFAETTSSAELFPYSIWTTTGSFDADLEGIDIYNIVPSASRIDVSFSSSVSASILSAAGNNFIEFTGYDIQFVKWGVSGSLPNYPGQPDKPLTMIDNKLIIDSNQINLSTYRTGSAAWDVNNIYPSGGNTATYGNPDFPVFPAGADDVDEYLSDLLFTQLTYSTMSITLQPQITSSLYTTSSEVARSKIDSVTFYYTYSGSAVTGSVTTGYIVVSGSDILTPDINGNPVRGVDINGPAQVQDFIGIGAENSLYNGSKMTSRGFNIESPDTIDGGPVVETRQSNPNQLIYQSPGENGSFSLSGQ